FLDEDVGGYERGAGYELPAKDYGGAGGEDYLSAADDYARLVGVGENVVPAGEDVLAAEEGVPAGVDAGDVVLGGPDGVHGVGVFGVEGAVEGLVGFEDGFGAWVVGHGA